MNEASRAMHYRWRDAPITAVVCVTLVFFAPLAAGRTFSMVGAHMYAQYPWAALVPPPDERVRGIGYPQTDHAETMYPLTVFATSALRAGELPSWLPYAFGGIPVLELGVSGLMYPPRLLAMLGLEPIRQHDLLLFLHLLAAGVGMTLLLREWGVDGFGAALGGITWELSGHNAFWLTLEHMAIAAAWLPLSLLAATRAARRRSMPWAVACGAAVGMSVLGGNLHYVVLNILILAGAGVRLAARSMTAGGRFPPAASLKLAGAAIATGAALSAACWLPLLAVIGDVQREPFALEHQAAGGVPWRTILRGATSPDVHVAGRFPDWSHLAHAGLTGLGLAVVAALKSRGPAACVARVVGLTGLAIALGWRPLLALLRILVPFFGTFHPHEGLYAYTFGLAVLAGFGMSELLGFAGRNPRRAAGPLAIAALLAAGQAAQLVWFGWAINPQHPAEHAWLLPSTPLITALQGSIGGARMLPVRWSLGDVWTPPVLTGKTPAAFGLPSGSGYESVIPRRTALFWATVEAGGVPTGAPAGGYKSDFRHDRLPLALLEKASVRLLATPPGVRPRDVSRDPKREGGLRLIYRGRDGWIYEDAYALPRAYVVPALRAMSDDGAVLHALADPGHDARVEALTVAPPGTHVDSTPHRLPVGARAEFVGDHLTEVQIRALMPEPGVLVLNDSWAPGWKAFIDGEEVPVLRVNHVFRAVRLEAGDHVVRFAYRPFWLLLGLTVSAAATAWLPIYLAVTFERRDRRADSPGSRRE